ncbi:hypothetical protein BDV95DRAFT_481538 [Massariosphaeria phaeospora]|uniref:Uncharacterized protein n=1 Tax=Massariosphaeria phaeospora TaxID=100035 RepID=A0A7C8MIB8_9PLEO|nr:hypothetical protein BDV95DRAFT_481538 [Massariosphaeria phaeospora]
MCDSTFTFGQRGSHYFQCPSRRDHMRSPKKLGKLLTSNQILQVHHVTLGFENSYLLTWRDKDGGDHIDSQGLPPELANFLYAEDRQHVLLRKIPQLRLTLGPYNRSFFVHDSSAYLWMNLPSGLLSAIQSRVKEGNWLDRPRIVALGADDNFLLVTENHSAVWDLSNYRTISSMLEFSRTQDRGIQEVHHIVLHAHRYQCFIAQSRNGTLIFENLPQHEVAGMQAMREAILKDTEDAERTTRLVRRTSEFQTRPREAQRRPSLQHRVTSTRDSVDRKQDLRAQTRGLKLSLSLSVSVAGLGKLLG